MFSVAARQEAWISSASSYSGGEETSAFASRITSLPTTPGPQVHFEEPARDIPDATLDTIATLSYDTEPVLNSPYARIKAAFTHTYDSPPYQVPSNDTTDVFITKSHYHSDSNIDYTNNNPSQSTKSTEIPRQSNSSYDYHAGMKPPLSLLEQKKLQWAKERG